MTKIEFSILKVFLLISGALSLFLTWVRIGMTIEGISIAFDFNLFGQVVGISLGGLEIDASYFQGRFFIEFLFPGLLYFLGFGMCVIQVRVDGIEKYETACKIGLVLMVGAMLLYVLNAYIVVSDLEQAWASIPEYSGSDMSASFQLQVGFYCGLITVGLIFADIVAQNVPYLKIGTPSNQYRQYGYTPQQGTSPYRGESYAFPVQSAPSENYCVKCGFLNKIENKFCKQCGFQLHENIKRCPKCKRMMPEGNKFCEECGYHFEKNEIECHKCGKTNKKQSKFCEHCGEKF